MFPYSWQNKTNELETQVEHIKTAYLMKCPETIVAEDKKCRITGAQRIICCVWYLLKLFFRY